METVPAPKTSGSENKNNQEINYLEIVKKAFYLTLHNKFLWLFGFILGFGSGNGAYFNFPRLANSPDSFLNGSDKTYPIKGNDKFLLENFDYQSFLNSISPNLPIIIFAISLFLLILGLAFFILRTISLGALITGIDKVNNKSPIDYKEAFRSGITHFWALLVVKLICLGIIFLTLIIFALPGIVFFSQNNPIAGVLIVILGLLIIFPVALIVSLIKNYAQIFIVLADKNPLDAFNLGFLLIKEKPKETLIVWLISWGSSIVYSIALMITLTILIALLALIFLVTGLLLGPILGPLGIIPGIVLGIIIILPTLSFLSGLLVIFVQSVWVLFFKRLIGLKLDEKEKEEEDDVLVKEATPAKAPTT